MFLSVNVLFYIPVGLGAIVTKLPYNTSVNSKREHPPWSNPCPVGGKILQKYAPAKSLDKNSIPGENFFTFFKTEKYVVILA